MSNCRTALSLGFLLFAAIMAGAADTSQLPFQTGTNKPAWDQKTQKRIESFTADYQETLHGRKPVLAQPNPTKESSSTDQYYQGDGYQVHVTKNPASLGGVNGFIAGAIFELEHDFAEGDMRSILHTAF